MIFAATDAIKKKRQKDLEKAQEKLALEVEALELRGIVVAPEELEIIRRHRSNRNGQHSV